MTEVQPVDVGTPEHIIEMARQGRLSKQALARFLAPDAQKGYLQTCAAIEKRLTEACGASGDPCLESGCAFEGQDEMCLQPLINAGLSYYQACGEAFAKVFADPRNRSSAWER